jgi:hypothetical protein
VSNDAGKPLQLLAFVSGTLVRDRVMVTAGHFTAPVKALGTMPPSVRAVASFSPTDARDPATWIPVARMDTHPSMPHCPPPPQCDPTDDSLVEDSSRCWVARSPSGRTSAHREAYVMARKNLLVKQDLRSAKPESYLATLSIEGKK